MYISIPIDISYIYFKSLYKFVPEDQSLKYKRDFLRPVKNDDFIS